MDENLVRGLMRLKRELQVVGMGFRNSLPNGGHENFSRQTFGGILAFCFDLKGVIVSGESGGKRVWDVEVNATWGAVGVVGRSSRLSTERNHSGTTFTPGSGERLRSHWIAYPTSMERGEQGRRVAKSTAKM